MKIVFLLAGVPLVAAMPAAAQAPPAGPVRNDPIVVTATRTERATADVPASIDSIDASRIHEGQLQVNLSETLAGLAGVVANNRQNYAQDLQISVRGFGARSTFGVRGVRLLVDGIPATLPDGQGQVSHIDLASAARIEVLRGPFSALYGNSSGGVINVFTADPRNPREAGASFAAGSDGTWRVGATGGLIAGPATALASIGQFETDGYRDHSAATRRNANLKARFDLGARTTLTVIGNALDMPEAQDPLGLTRAQFERDPRSVDPAALQFDTRKSVDQLQGGLTLDHDLGHGQSLRFMAYAGQRGTLQYQAIPVAPQASPLHPGGVIDLDRSYSGIDARWTGRMDAGGSPLTLVAGASRDGLDEGRRGYQNFSGATLGVLGALRRDEDNRVTDTSAYAQLEWEAAPAWRLAAGVRASRVEFRSDDHYVTAANPDDSGQVNYRATTPAAGVTWHAAQGLSLHVAAGRGFETPTTNELAYRPSGATGLNLDLKPAKSDNFEIGAKAFAGPWRATATVFRVNTHDEIVVQANSGGRSSFRNAGATRREGLELQAERDWSAFGITASYTLLKAEYRESFGTCVATPCTNPTVIVAAGNLIPGVPRQTAYAELRWRPSEAWLAALEARHASRVMVNDLNTESAEGYVVGSARVGYTWRRGNAIARPFLRVDNLFDRRYAGSVIVNEGNARYYEPAPGRTWLAGISFDSPF